MSGDTVDLTESKSAEESCVLALLHMLAQMQDGQTQATWSVEFADVLMHFSIQVEQKEGTWVHDC